MARNKVHRNVVALYSVPVGQTGRPSKSLTLPQAEALLAAAEETPLHAYVVLSLLTGARTEEIRALRWNDIDLAGNPHSTPPVPPSISVLRSVRQGGDTKTRKSRRRIAIPSRCVDALTAHRATLERLPDGEALVFGTRNGTELDSHNVRHAFRRIVAAAGLDPAAWTPRELRHSFVSLLSCSAQMPPASCRARQSTTVGRVVPARLAISAFGNPSAASNIRGAGDCVGRRCECTADRAAAQCRSDGSRTSPLSEPSRLRRVAAAGRGPREDVPRDRVPPADHR